MACEYFINDDTPGIYLCLICGDIQRPQWIPVMGNPQVIRVQNVDTRLETMRELVGLHG